MADTQRLRVLRHVLAPVARFCLRNSISMPEVLEALKSAFIEVAAEQMAAEDVKVTVSRISVMSGITRREVTRIYRDEQLGGGTPSIVSRVIGYWEQDPRFCTKSKVPRVLSFRGERNEFKSLIECVSKDINPATILFEMERIGAVQRSAQGVRLVGGVDYQHQVPERGLNLLARDFETLGNAVSENIFSEQEVRNLHIRTEYDNVFLDDLPTIKRWILERGTAFHKQVRDYLSTFDADLNPAEKKKGGGRVVVGAFSWMSEAPSTARRTRE